MNDKVTPILTDHARQRCEEMGISTKIAKRIVRNPSLTRPGHTSLDRRFVYSTLHPEYAVIYDEAENKIITVLFYSPDQPFVRPERCE